MQNLPPVADELAPPELVGHWVKDPGVQQPEDSADHDKWHRVARNLGAARGEGQVVRAQSWVRAGVCNAL
jgi:hypothetical protein